MPGQDAWSPWNGQHMCEIVLDLFANPNLSVGLPKPLKSAVFGVSSSLRPLVGVGGGLGW